MAMTSYKMHPSPPKVSVSTSCNGTTVFMIETYVQRHYVYTSMLIPSLGEELSCTWESGDDNDSHTVVAIQKGHHVPKKSSAACSLFAGRNPSMITEKSTFQLIYRAIITTVAGFA